MAVVVVVVYYFVFLANAVYRLELHCLFILRLSKEDSQVLSEETILWRHLENSLHL